MGYRKNKGHGVTRRQILKYSLYSILSTCSTGGVFWLSGCRRQTWDKMPNIVFILIDALRADHLLSYGYNINTAPNIQRLIQQGVIFERVIAQSSWTKTSMASVMTSCYPSSHGVRGVKDVLPGQLTTIAEELSANGYYTIGVNTNPWLLPPFGFNAGFDIYENRVFAKAKNVNKKALEFLRQYSKKKPVFLYLHYMDVHAPYLPNRPFFSGKPLHIPGRGEVKDSELEHLYRKEGLDSPGVQQRVIDLYDGEIKAVDAAISQLLNEWQRIYGLDNTIFVITSDHGESFREHGTTEHGWNIYPEVYEVPLVFFWQGNLPAGTKIKAQVRLIDIAPTLLELIGLNVPASFQGNSLMPMENNAIDDHLAMSAVGLNDYIPNLDYVAVISRQHFYVREKVNSKVEFYDLQLDPGAQHNLGPAHPMAKVYAEHVEKRSVDRTPEQFEMDQKTREQLRSLGYL